MNKNKDLRFTRIQFEGSISLRKTIRKDSLIFQQIKDIFHSLFFTLIFHKSRTFEKFGASHHQSVLPQYSFRPLPRRTAYMPNLRRHNVTKVQWLFSELESIA